MNQIFTERIIKKYPNHVAALIEMAHLFNNHQVEWSLGGSMMLALKGIQVSVNDLDIIVRTNQIDQLEDLMRDYAPKQDIESTIYLTDHFYHITIGHVEIDVMVGFKVKTKNGIYSYNDRGPRERVDIDGTTVFLASLEEWLDAYRSMNRVEKIQLIEDYLRK